MDPDIRSAILMDPDMDRPVKNPVPIRSESDKINGYGYEFRPIRSELDPLTGLTVVATTSNISGKLAAIFNPNFRK